MNLSKIEFYLIKHLNLQPSEIDNIEFYRLEYLIEHFKEYIEEEKKRTKESEIKGQTFNINSFKQDYNNLVKDFSKNTSLTNFGKFLNNTFKFNK